MDKNKSIDGLAPRRSKKTPISADSEILKSKTTSKSPNKKSTTKATSKPKPTKSRATTTKTPKSTKASAGTIKPRAVKSGAKPVKNRTTKTTKPRTLKQNLLNLEIPETTENLYNNSLHPEDIYHEAEDIYNNSESQNQNLKTASLEPSANAEDFLTPVQAFDFDEQSGELKASKNQNLKKAKKPKKAKKKMSKKKKIIIWIISILILLILGLGIWLVIWGNDIIAKITGGQGNVFDLVFMDYKKLKTDENGRTNILAFGTSGYNMDGDEGYGTHDGAQLTDSIMVISLNQETGDLAMLSLPRDLKASPTCTETGKINEVYWCNNMEGNNEQAGAEALMNEVGSILGIDFQYYAHLNWGSLIQIVDTLGGIKITLDEDIADYYFTNAVFNAGEEYTIDGAQALGLARARHGTESGDFSRGASQQKILIGIKDKISEKDLSISDMLSLAGTLGDNLRTNFSVDEMKSLAHLTSEFDFNNIRQVSLIEPEELVTTGTLNGISYVLPVGGVGYYDKIQEYVDKMFSNDPKVYENASILVLNGSGTSGLASIEQQSLEEDGYKNIYIDDAPTGKYNNKYTLYSLADSAPETKSLLEKKYDVTAKPSSDLPANFPTDYNFILLLGNSKE